MNRKITVIVAIISMLLFVSCGQTEKIALDSEPQSSQMKAICELSTMECYYHNVAKYNEEDASGFLIWTKDKNFWVEYSGIVKVGIDASQLQMNVKENIVTISIPKAKILGSKVDLESLTENSFYIDKDSAKIEAKDQTEAFKVAEEYMVKKASNDTTLLSNAQQRAQILLEDYVNNIGDVTGMEYEIKWVYLDKDDVSDSE